MASPISLPAFQSPPASSCSDPNLHHGNLPSSRSPNVISLLRKPQSLSCYRLSHFPASPPSSSRVLESSNLYCCHCLSSSSDSSAASDDDGGGVDNSRWDFPVRQLIRTAAQKLDELWKSRSSGDVKEFAGTAVEDRELRGEEEIEAEVEVDVEDWDWERWQKHFKEVEKQEHSISVLKSQMDCAIHKEDYEEAARIKIAIAAIATKDTVGSVISFLNRALEDERYQDAAFVHDNAGAGLVGWWAGVSDDKRDPYGCIIHISAEHGRYVARSFSPWQLATSGGGAPLFEIFLILNKRGEYRQQAVYLKRKAVSQSFPSIFPKSSPSLSTLNPSGTKGDLFDPVADDPEDNEDGDDSDVSDGLSGFHSILQDPVPDVKVKVLKVIIPGKVDQDSISKMVDQLMEEEDEEKQIDFDIGDIDDEVAGESEKEKDEVDVGAGSEIIDMDEQNEIAMRVVVGGVIQKLSSRMLPKDLLRVPAKLHKKGRKTFSFSVEDDDDKKTSGRKGQPPTRRRAKVRGQHSVHRVMLDLAKFINKGEKIPMKVLKDVGDLVSFTLTQAQNRQPLSGSTTFNRIELPGYPDPLNGLYIGAHGPYTSEVIQLRHKFGQWKDGISTNQPDLEFYEYVEAVKLTGDPYVPAGEVAFRAKVGKRYQLPHKGIIPEEFGVIARYRGEGRLAEPGYRNPRWVDGELVILDGKYIKAGPVVGFVYWAPEYQFLVFFQRLRLQE